MASRLDSRTAAALRSASRSSAAPNAPNDRERAVIGKYDEHGSAYFPRKTQKLPFSGRIRSEGESSRKCFCGAPLAAQRHAITEHFSSLLVYNPMVLTIFTATTCACTDGVKVTRDLFCLNEMIGTEEVYRTVPVLQSTLVPERGKVRVRYPCAILAGSEGARRTLA